MLHNESDTNPSATNIYIIKKRKKETKQQTKNKTKIIEREREMYTNLYQPNIIGYKSGDNPL